MNQNTEKTQERLPESGLSETGVALTEAEASREEAEVMPEGEGAVVQEREENAPPAMDEKEAEALCAHPMFSHFAKGRGESFDKLLLAFREMLRADKREEPQKEIEAKITPSATMAAVDVPLTERQRAICRAAGMTYREYYALMEKN